MIEQRSLKMLKILEILNILHIIIIETWYESRIV